MSSCDLCHLREATAALSRAQGDLCNCLRHHDAGILPTVANSEFPKQAPRACSPLQWPVPFTIRDFQPADFDTLWNIDQLCFPPGISYSRAELKLYIRRRGSFTLLAVDATP